jgi:hypothetical protein
VELVYTTPEVKVIRVCQPSLVPLPASGQWLEQKYSVEGVLSFHCFAVVEVSERPLALAKGPVEVGVFRPSVVIAVGVIESS